MAKLFAGHVKKLIAGSFGVQFPAFRPSPLVQLAYRQGQVEFECWSLFSLVQRLMAAGLGMPFLPTQSLAGSTMATNHSYRVVSHPITSEAVPVVLPLHPDVAFVHALAADPIGNAIATPPFEDDLWSTRAARTGVIVLAENLVTTDFLRQHAHLVKIPGYRVLAVCHTPFAQHPEGFDSGIDLGLEIQHYQRDDPNYQAYFEATKDPERFRAWLDRWVLTLDSHAAYLDAVGTQHLMTLRGAGTNRRTDWRDAYERPPGEVEPRWSAKDMMVVATARVICAVAQRRALSTILVGAGIADMAGSLAFYLLRRVGYTVDLVQGTGSFGFEPVPVPDFKQLTATMLAGTVDVYGTIVGGSDSRCLALLGAGEIDARGNINSTLSNGNLLVGSGGANDAVSLAAETIVMLRQRPGRMVEAVQYVTCAGARVGHLVTDYGVFHKGVNDRFVLERYYPFPSVESPSAALARVQETCGWVVEVAADLAAMDPPAIEELRLLRWLDPGGEVSGDG